MIVLKYEVEGEYEHTEKKVQIYKNENYKIAEEDYNIIGRRYDVKNIDLIVYAE